MSKVEILGNVQFIAEIAEISQKVSVFSMWAGIGKMSEQRRGSPRFQGNSGAGPISVNLIYCNVLIVHPIPYPVVPYINMLRPSVKHLILD
ncbi:AP2/B3-like transcriptional factor family protein [Prunus dulcis]|uniref:AP2/B3-like transcriptional factor family protein n=1 Tax=Prunus dulcis TaxID=3755 RepID=A0A4Y1QP69_PRUDU|nr:AP2/B3-like transcriptional factor family protein [Prunus dulcis]